VPDHLLKKQKRAIVVRQHLLAGAKAILNRVAYGASAVVEPGSDGFGVGLAEPFAQ
jgi:hypothetical protein